MSKSNKVVFGIFISVLAMFFANMQVIAKIKQPFTLYLANRIPVTISLTVINNKYPELKGIIEAGVELYDDDNGCIFNYKYVSLGRGQSASQTKTVLPEANNFKKNITTNKYHLTIDNGDSGIFTRSMQYNTKNCPGFKPSPEYCDGNGCVLEKIIDLLHLPAATKNINVNYIVNINGRTKGNKGKYKADLSCNVSYS